VEVSYVDEADVDFNPKLGAVWTRRGQQVGIPTPGQHQKHYLAGALHAHSGRLVWVEHTHKTTALFITQQSPILATAEQVKFLPPDLSKIFQKDLGLHRKPMKKLWTPTRIDSRPWYQAWPSAGDLTGQRQQRRRPFDGVGSNARKPNAASFEFTKQLAAATGNLTGRITGQGNMARCRAERAGYRFGDGERCLDGKVRIYWPCRQT
jgi:hypothetical protein